jgi:hypothetical protein
MTRALGGNAEPVLACRGHSRSDVIGVLWKNDSSGTLVNREVPGGARLVPVVVARMDDSASDLRRVDLNHAPSRSSGRRHASLPSMTQAPNHGAIFGTSATGAKRLAPRGDLT